MKVFAFAMCVALATSSVGYTLPAAAQTAPTLTCTITPGGLPSTTTCTTNYAWNNYNAQFVISGLPAGSYTYAWSANKPAGLESGCDDVCNLSYNADGMDYRNVVTVTATNLSNGMHYTLSNHVSTLGVCYNVNIHFC